MNAHIVPVKTYLAVFAALMALLVATVAASFLNLGPFSIVVALTIAMVKALLIVLYFMHVRYSSRLTRVFVIAGVVWLIIMLSLTMNDYISRSWLGVPGH